MRPKKDVKPEGPKERVRLPQIVPIVLQQAAKLRNKGEISEADYDEKVLRLVQEEIAPRGLELEKRESRSGGLRILIKDSRTHRVCETIDCPRCPSAKSRRCPYTPSNPAELDFLLAQAAAALGRAS